MDAGMKIFLKFSENFWGDDVQDITIDGYSTFIWAPGMGRPVLLITYWCVLSWVKGLNI